MIVKHLLAYVLVFYEFKFTDETTEAAIKANANTPIGQYNATKAKPKDFELGGATMPSNSAELLFRRRKDDDLAFIST
jgi:hypothetical protein